MKRLQQIIVAMLIVTALLIVAPFEVSAARSQTLEQIYATGDYHVGSVYGPRLNQTELDQVAEAVLRFVESYDWTGTDDITKVYYAHQYLCNICDYAPDWSKNRANTAWGALVYGEAQCSGYARAFKALCDAIGIGCYYVHADENAFNPSHQWNEVCVDGGWYIIDVQSNDSSGFPVVLLVSGDTYARRFGMSWNHEGLPECPRDYVDQGQPVPLPQDTYEVSAANDGDVPVENCTTETVTDGSGNYYVNEYDENGNLVKCFYYYADGTLWSIDEYDGNDRLTEIYLKLDGTIDWFVVSEFVYEENIGHAKTTVYNADGTIDYCVFSESIYDEEGNEVEFASQYEDGTFVSHICYEYGADGKIVKIIYYHENGTVDCYVIREYNAYGKRAKDTFYAADGSVEFYWIGKFDSNGELVDGDYWNASQTARIEVTFEP